MNRFRTGQKVVSLGKKSEWVYENKFTGLWLWKKPKKANGPDKGEIVTVQGYHAPGLIYLQEYMNGDRFHEKWFMPLQEDVSAIELVNKELCHN